MSFSVDWCKGSEFVTKQRVVQAVRTVSLPGQPKRVLGRPPVESGRSSLTRLKNFFESLHKGDSCLNHNRH